MKSLWVVGLLLSALAMLPSKAMGEENAPLEAPKAETPKVEEKPEAPKVETAKVEVPKAPPTIQTPPPAATPGAPAPAAPVAPAPAAPVAAAAPVAPAPVAEVKAPVKQEPKGFNKRWNLTVNLSGGGYDSKGDASFTFSNPSQLPTFTSGEKVSINTKEAGGSGFQLGGGFRLNNWFSANALVMAFSSQSETQITTASGNKHHLNMDSGIFYISPFTWTAYPISWLYVSAGLGVVVEGHKIKSDIPTLREFEMGGGGAGSTFGVGVEFALGKTWTLRGGLDLFSATLAPHEKKLNQGTTNEVTLKLEERKVNTGTLTIGTKIYF